MLKNASTKLNDKVLGEVKTKEGPLVVIKKQHLAELTGALRAIIRGENALSSGKTKSFKEFIKKRAPKNAKHK